MKKAWLTVFLVGLLVFGTLVAAGCPFCPGGGTTKVMWSIGECWIILHVHSPVDLGEAVGPGEILESNGNPVTVLTNCRGYTLQVRVSRFHVPHDFCGDLLADFSWRVGSSAASPGVTFVQSSWTQFPNFGVDVTVATSSTPSLPGGDTYLMDYKYLTDSCDVGGHYWVELCYTVTAP
jgi:hypothetical protein